VEWLGPAVWKQSAEWKETSPTANRAMASGPMRAGMAVTGIQAGYRRQRNHRPPALGRGTGQGLGCGVMAEIVLRVRLIGGERLDVTYDAPEDSSDDALDHVIAALAQADGILRCRHGDRLVVLYGRGVATLEAAPRGAVL